MGQKVLVVEDDPDLQFLWRSLLERESLDVLSASFGREALELLRGEAPAVLLLDVHLPDMSGWDVLDELAVDPMLASIPVVMLSGEERKTADGKPVFRFLTKPVPAEQLLGAVRDALAGS